MYNSQYSNNPFLEDPSAPSSRFPDLGTIERASASSSFASPGYPNASGAGYASPGFGQTFGQQQQPQTTGYGFQQPALQQQQSYGPGLGSAAWQSSGPTSPYGAYGGGAGQQVTGYQGAYGGQVQQQQQQQQQYPQPQQYGGYGTPQYGGAGGFQGYAGQQGYGGQPQQQQSQAYISEFDPLAASSSSFPSNPQSSSAPGGSGSGSSQHPREYIRSHKRELEMWDNVSWKQALNSFDVLRVAWESHKSQIGLKLQQQGYYLGPVEGQRLQGLQKEAENNIDSITASSIQMQEVLQGYRVSTDVASRNRVRESMNAALQSLPEWPPQNW